jgi:diguanylate cyclase (GGDEF)-like protein
LCDRLIPGTKDPQVLLDWLEQVRAMREGSVVARAVIGPRPVSCEDREPGRETLFLYASSLLGRLGENLGDVIAIDEIGESGRVERILEPVLEAIKRFVLAVGTRSVGVAAPPASVGEGSADRHGADGVIDSKALEVLFRIAHEMKKLLDLRELLDHLAYLIAEEMGYSDCVILLPDDDGEHLVIAAGVGMSQAAVGMMVPYGKGISWWVFTNGKPQNIPDVSMDPRYYEIVDRVGSELHIPLEVRGRTLGVLVVQKTEKGGFTPSDVRLMMAVAGPIASALEVAQLHEKVKKSADGDVLTGLANRRVFLSSLETAIVRAQNDDYGRVVSVAILDVNQLKAVNDRYGHLAGDAVLSSIGSRLGSGFRMCDVVARYGGDEFVVLLPGASKESASKRIEEVISQWVKDTVDSPDGEKVQVPGACFGVASYPEDGREARVVLSVADNRLLRAKKRGGPR